MFCYGATHYLIIIHWLLNNNKTFSTPLYTVNFTVAFSPLAPSLWKNERTLLSSKPRVISVSTWDKIWQTNDMQPMQPSFSSNNYNSLFLDKETTLWCFYQSLFFAEHSFPLSTAWQIFQPHASIVTVVNSSRIGHDSHRRWLHTYYYRYCRIKRSPPPPHTHTHPNTLLTVKSRK